MPIELKMLLFTSILGIFQLHAAALVATSMFGIGWNLSPRDTQPPGLEGKAGRMNRSFKNFMETFPFFVAGILILASAQRFNSSSALGAQLYFWARLIYVPIYVAGIPGLRTLVWLVSFVGLALVLWSAF